MDGDFDLYNEEEQEALDRDDANVYPEGRPPYCVNGHYEEHPWLPLCIDELLAGEKDN